MEHGLIGLVLIGKIDGFVFAYGEFDIARHLAFCARPGPLHSTWTANVLPSRLFCRIVQRPNADRSRSA